MSTSSCANTSEDFYVFDEPAGSRHAIAQANCRRVQHRPNALYIHPRAGKHGGCRTTAARRRAARRRSCHLQAGGAGRCEARRVHLACVQIGGSASEWSRALLYTLYTSVRAHTARHAPGVPRGECCVSISIPNCRTGGGFRGQRRRHAASLSWPWRTDNSAQGVPMDEGTTPLHAAALLGVLEPPTRLCPFDRAPYGSDWQRILKFFLARSSCTSTSQSELEAFLIPAPRTVLRFEPARMPSSRARMRTVSSRCERASEGPFA